MSASRASGRELALITGASAGIGLELARIFAARDFDLIVVARRAAALEALAESCSKEHGAEVRVWPMDLLEDGAPERLAERLDAEQAKVDVLVNNAGVLDMGRFAEIELAAHERLLRLNVVVLAAVTRSLLPGMIERGRGRVLNVASTASFQPVPSLALYAASKAFVLSLSESLSEELRGTGVTVTALCPGLTRTEMYEKVEGQNETLKNLSGLFVSAADDVARQGFDACMAGEPIVVPGLSNRLLASASQLYPRWLVRAVGGAVGRWNTRSGDRS